MNKTDTAPHLMGLTFCLGKTDKKKINILSGRAKHYGDKYNRTREVGSGLINVCSSSGKDFMWKLHASSFMIVCQRMSQKAVRGDGVSQCKGPEEGMCLVSWGHGKGPCDWGRGRKAGNRDG